MFEQSGLGTAVGPVQAVQTEVSVVGRIAEVAPVSPSSGAVGQPLNQAMVPPLPDKAALQAVGGFDRIPVLGQSAVAVAHGVRVLAHDQGVALAARPGVGDDRGDGRIHRTDDVADALIAEPIPADATLVVKGPRWVVAPDPASRRVVVGAVARLVAERPQDHRNVVLVAPNHPRDAVHPCVQIARVVAYTVDEGMGLDVGLGHDVEAQLVAQVEEDRFVRIVGRPDRIEAELLHGHQIGPYRRGRNDAPGVLVEIVAVDAADQHRGAVDQQVHALDLDAPEADPQIHFLCRLARRRAQDDVKWIEIRPLSRPLPDVGDLGAQPGSPVDRGTELGRQRLPLGLLSPGQTHRDKLRHHLEAMATHRL